MHLERSGAEIAYVRTTEGFEVDFLARYPDGNQQLIQVCADLGTLETQERETRALLAAIDEHPQASPHIVALATDAIRGLPEKVNLHSAASWLLETDEGTIL